MFLVVDSLLTYSGGLTGPPRRIDATFREPAEPSPERPSVEIGCKLFRLGSGVVACYAGSSSSALGALISIRDQLKLGTSLRRIVESIDFQEGSGHFELLLGRGNRDETHFYYLDSEGNRRDLYEDRIPTVLGSLPDEGKSFVRRTALISYGLPGVSPNPDQVLGGTVAALQAFGRRVDLIKDRAGGAFFGMRSSGGQVHPQPELFYLVFSKHDLALDNGIEVARVGIRSDALFAWPLAGNPAIYVSDLGVRSDEEYERLIRDHLSSTRMPRFYCLVERNVGALVCIDSPHGPPSKFLKFRQGGRRITLLPAVMEYVNRIPDATSPLPTEVPHFFIEHPHSTYRRGKGKKH